MPEPLPIPPFATNYGADGRGITFDMGEDEIVCEVVAVARPGYEVVDMACADSAHAIQTEAALRIGENRGPLR